jgi:hypothetical protein
MKILKKIAKAKSLIKATEMKKAGKNTYSNYDYFLPEQIEKLVSDACEEVGLLTKFDLKKAGEDYTGYLTIYDIDTDESLIYEMSTAIPNIKATNVSQQLGGAMTYTERYLKTSAFGIADNSADFDSHKPEKEASKPTTGRPELWLNPGTPEWEKAIEYLREGGTINEIEKKYRLSKVNKEKLISNFV